ncbi:hypothetical protein GIB67_039877 [Kingdonia uniflora]|uniref:Uncharacterized protein n=1 Tax=Kingdonia uniflora TaxID=39325 RepID=A0A7J7P396_9MAGN|nr:hypothetical protein GIB67_039877 [Kingdonia uniflora]
MVDGNGLLHPIGKFFLLILAQRHRFLPTLLEFWLAYHLGVLADLPTIGIGKNCGRIGSTAADVTLIIHTSSAMPEVATSPASD